MWIFCELTIEIFAKMSYILVKELGMDLIIRQKVIGRIERPQAKPVFVLMPPAAYQLSGGCRMDRALFLEVLKDSYSAYYNIVPVTDEDAPLAFRADYFSRDERYWLTKNITMWGNEKNEYAYIFAADSFDCAQVDECVRRALDESLPRVKPHKEHQCSNIKVLFIADRLDAATVKHIKKLKYSKSYKFSLHGYTELKAGGVDLSEKKVCTNRAGNELAPYFSKLFAARD